MAAETRDKHKTGINSLDQGGHTHKKETNIYMKKNAKVFACIYVVVAYKCWCKCGRLTRVR